MTETGPETADFLLVRVDDRLLHGQVAFGWGQALQPQAYLIVDDQIAADPWECEAFIAAAPPESPVTVLDLDHFIESWRILSKRADTVVLIRGLCELERLFDAGFQNSSPINLGGLHAQQGSLELLTFLHVTPDDRTILLRLLKAAFPLEARDLPMTSPVQNKELKALLLAD